MTATATTTTQSKSSQKLLPADVRWCIDNKDDLSLVTYVDHFTLASRGYAVRRYKHIIKKYIPRDERGRLLSELKFFKNTVRYYQYWYDIMQRKLVIKAKYRSSILLDAAMKNQAKEVLISFRGESSSNNSHNTTTEEDDSDAADVNLTTEDSLPDTSSVDDNHGASSTSSSPRALSHNSSGTYSC